MAGAAEPHRPSLSDSSSGAVQTAPVEPLVEHPLERPAPARLAPRSATCKGSCLDSELHIGPKAPTTTGGGPSSRLVFGIVAIALFMSTVDLTIVATALPAIHRSLHASINWAGWTITIYGLGSVIALPIAGKLGDQFGRRRIFLLGIALFTVSSLLCGLATDIYMLVFFRAAQAIGGGAFQPSAAGLIVEHFGNNRDRAIGMFGTIQAGGQVAGPVVGGLLVGYWSWRGVFFVNVPIGVVLLCLTIRFIPESQLRTRTKTDLRGILLLSSFVFAAIYGITNLGSGRTSVYDPAFLIPEAGARSACCTSSSVTRIGHQNRSSRCDSFVARALRQ